MKRPENYDNNWLGITCTIAHLWEGKKIVGTCLDTPNAVAYAKAMKPTITKATGILGKYDMKDIESRIWFCKDNPNLGKGLKLY